VFLAPGVLAMITLYHNIKLVATFLVLSTLLGCKQPSGPWTVEGGTNAQQAQTLSMVQVAKDTTNDRTGLLRGGGVIAIHSDRKDALVGLCSVPPGYVPAGCVTGFRIDVLVWEPDGLGPDMRTTALSHELCHLGLDTLDEPKADSCGTTVNSFTLPLEQF
jgi:hypothetical protein